MIRNPEDIANAEKKIRILIAGYPGIGKALANGTPVLTENGFEPIEELCIGDKVFGEDGLLHTITGVFPQGYRPNYDVFFNDGICVRCDENHIWTVCATAGNSAKQGWRNMTTKELIDRGIIFDSPCRESTNRAPMLRWKVPIGQAPAFSEKSFTVPPYLMGVFLGDGCLSNGKPLFVSPEMDSEIAQRVQRELPDGFSLSKYDKEVPAYYVKYNGKTNDISREIKKLGLNVNAGHKTIPPEYLHGNIEQRLDLLRGLMDTDGSATNNRVTFCTTSDGLADDVVSLVRSLGGFARKHGYDRSAEGKSTEYHIQIRINYCPFYLKRKAEAWKPTLYNRMIRKIEKAGDAECTCIMVDNPSGLFVTRDYAVTHNSTLGLSSPKALHVDIDFGIDRIEPQYRRPYIQPSSYEEVLGDLVPENLKDFDTLVFDTGGKLIDLMKPWAIKMDPKNGKRDGSLSLQGYGVVGREFVRLMDHCFYILNKHVVVIFHAVEDKDGENTRLRLMVEGQTKNNVWIPMDLGGFVEMFGNDRTLGLSNCERYYAKGTRGVNGVIKIPTLEAGKANDFLTKLFDRYNEKSAEEVAQVKEQEEAYLAAMREGAAIIGQVSDAHSANRQAKAIGGLQHALTSKDEIGDEWKKKVAALGLVFDKKTKLYADPPAEDELEPEA